MKVAAATASLAWHRNRVAAASVSRQRTPARGLPRRERRRRLPPAVTLYSSSLVIVGWFSSRFSRDGVISLCGASTNDGQYFERRRDTGGRGFSIRLSMSVQIPNTLRETALG